MSVVIISESAGLIGAEAARRFAAQGLDVVGIDNDMRREFFGAGASTTDSRLRLERDLGSPYTHVASDIRDADADNGPGEYLFESYTH
jgi:CDP-paratose 2-epimerase